MALTTVAFDDSVLSDGETASAIELLTKNTMTTAGVIVAAGTGVAGAALLTAALPAQMLAAAGTSAALIYAGDRQAKDLPVFPWGSTPDKSASADTTEAVAS